MGEKILTSGDQAWDHVEAVDASFLTAVTAGGPIGISCDLTKLSENTRRLIADTVSEFKRDRSFRMNAECRILCGAEASDDDEANAAVLYNKGVKNVIVTLGDKGSMLYNAEGVVTVPAQKVTAIDTVAAGDTYNGALCVALSKGKSFVEAMEFATAASAIAVTRIGAQASIPFASELK